jgi:hypothetical protein
MFRPVAALVAAVLLFAPSLAFADDWGAEKLRGRVLQLIDGEWQPLEAGMVVPDTRVIRTLATGHVTFVRGQETVELGPHTQVQIFDKAGRRPFTTVKQYFGSVSVEAQVENVQHFAVDTPFLAAVVKGTRFIVTSSESGSTVRVRRGHVAVENKGDDSHVTLSVGQSATVDLFRTKGALVVHGFGRLPPVIGGGVSPGKPSAADNAPGGGLVSLDIGDSGTDGRLIGLGIGGSGNGNGLVDLGVGGGSLVDLDVGGSNHDGGSGLVNLSVGGSGNDDENDGSSGQGGAQSGQNGSSRSGKLLNLDIGGIHLGL